MRRNRRRGIFRDLLCMARGPGMSPPSRDDIVPCGGYLLTSHYPSVAKKEAAPGKSSVATTSAGGGGVGDYEMWEEGMDMRTDLLVWYEQIRRIV